MKGCKICGRDFRTGKRIHIADDNGRMVRAIVCLGCASKAVMFIPRPAVKCDCGMPATSCATCAHQAATKDASERLKLAALVKRLKGLHAALVLTTPRPGSDGTYVAGQAAGLESAIALVESGRW